MGDFVTSLERPRCADPANLFNVTRRDEYTLSPLRVLSVRQPWASAIVYGPKRIENRSKPLPQTVAGPPQERRPFWVAISASGELDDGAQATVNAWRSSVPDSDVLCDTTGAWPSAPADVKNLTDYPRGAILGYARVLGQIVVPMPPLAARGEFPDWSALRKLRARYHGGLWLAGAGFGYILDPTVLRLPKPISWTGALGFQMPSPELQLWFKAAVRGDTHVELNADDFDPRAE
jgi:hypothetical protein